MSEKKRNTADLSGEVMAQSVGRPEEEVKLNTPVPTPHLNSCKVPPSLEEAWKPDAVRSVASDNSGIECNNENVIEKNDCDYGSVKLYSPSGMQVLVQNLFIFDAGYIYLLCVLLLSFM